MKLATWNVNSLRVRLEQVLAWSGEARPDLLALQETKVSDDNFPLEALNAAGWQVRYTGQRSYNGVAVLSRSPTEHIADALPAFEDPARRLLAVRSGDLVLVNIYVPNGQTVASGKYEYKLAWLAALTRYLSALAREHEQVAVVGDFNIAPEDRDVHDPAAWEGSVLVSEAERAAFRELLALGFEDGFRLFGQPEASYSWWDYRQAAFRRNRGLRIDHILLSPALAGRCRAVTIDRAPRAWERPSDHTPVVAEFD
ncbi:MAG: exodeoxyribonuclease III [Gammaproteobacteria bacterium]